MLSVVVRAIHVLSVMMFILLNFFSFSALVGSHAIWHCFIVLAVSQHKAAIGRMKGGMQCFV